MPEPAARGADSDFHLIEIDEPEPALVTLIEVVTKRIPARFGLDPVRDVQVLTPMQRGVLGARNLNHELQAVLNPNPAISVERFGWRFSPGGRVMESQNDYDREVFNGDLGTVVRIDEDEGAVIVDFDGREVVYPYGELDTLVPGRVRELRHVHDAVEHVRGPWGRGLQGSGGQPTGDAASNDGASDPFGRGTARGGGAAGARLRGLGRGIRLTAVQGGGVGGRSAVPGWGRLTASRPFGLGQLRR